MKFSLSQLMAIECIKQIKYRYMRSIDTRDFQLLESCFTPDARASYSDGQHLVSGSKEIVRFVNERLGNTGSSHEAGHPEIAFVNRDCATGIWRLTDTVHYIKSHPPIGCIPITGTEVSTGAAYYHEEYVRLDGGWKIDFLRYELLFRHISPRQGEVAIAPDCASS